MPAGGRLRTLAASLAAIAACCALAAPTGADVAPAFALGGGLEAGAAKVDITPPTGFRTDGWATNDRAVGTITRLYARALVLQSAGRKVALVTLDLVGSTGGVVKEAAQLDKDVGFSESNVLVSGTHTHSGAGQYSNYGELNAGFPAEKQLVSDPKKFFDFAVGGPPDVQEYTFMIQRVALAIRLANENLGPAVAGWSDQQLLGVTQNRSLEAHLANFGLNLPDHTGNASQDPGGYPDTIDPALPVLRVDKLVHRGGRLVHEPIGAWTDFANHGTNVEHTFAAYGGDHQAIAERLFEAAVRRAGHVPPGQAVINAFADGAEGDMSSGLVHNGPAWAVHIGTLEAQAMFRGWRAAGTHMTRQLTLDYRWTRSCFCGHTVKGGGAVDTKAVIGLPVFTGSEEGRGPLYDATGVSFEGRHLPVSVGPQGDKIPVVVDLNHQDDPPVVPIQVVRIGDHLLAAVPGEPTVEMGRRMRAAIRGAVGGVGSSGIRTVAIIGLANEYVDYYTTPAEFEYQDYEGGHTVYGKWSGYFIRDQLADLAGRLVRGVPAPAPYQFDPTNGIKDDGAPFSQGATTATPVSQPTVLERFADSSSWFQTARGGSGALQYAAARYICLHYDLAARSVGASAAAAGAPPARLQRISFSWQGGPKGYDRPLDRAFVTVERSIGGGQWRDVADDLGYEILWTVDSNGVYRAVWQPPVDAALGRYRFLVTANHYTLASNSFVLRPSSALTVRRVAAGAPGRVAVQLGYPPVLLASELDTDLIDWPSFVSGGTVKFRVGRKTVVVRRASGAVFSVRAPAGARVSVVGAMDRYGNSAAV